VTVPSVEGEMGVMYGHEAVIASLQEGQIKIFDDKQNVVKTFDVKAGFAEMQGSEKLLILLDS
jgi:F0F1-type ATP synthase epsilon subunit